MQDNHIRTDHSKHYLKAHIILVCKYPKKLPIGQLKEDMYNNPDTILGNPDFTVKAFESDMDHIHFPIRYIPRLSISQIVRRSEQQPTKLIIPRVACRLHPIHAKSDEWVLR